MIIPKEFLLIEGKSAVKHAYQHGQVYAMVGAADADVTIALNLAALLRSHSRGSGYRIYIPGMKARIESLNRFYYPDVMIFLNQRIDES